MKKIKLNKSEALNSILTREQLKDIVGESGSYSSSQTKKPCEDKSEGASYIYGMASQEHASIVHLQV